MTVASTAAGERTAEERTARVARLAWNLALGASVLLPALRITLGVRGHDLPPLVTCWLGLVAVLSVGVYAALAYARGEARRAAVAALALLPLIAYVSTVLPTNPAECAAYLHGLGPG